MPVIRRQTNRVNRLWVRLLLLALAFPTAAVAQDSVPEFSLQRFRPASGPGDYLTNYGTGVDDHLKLSGGFYFNVANDPLKLLISTEAQPQSVVDYQFGADLFMSMGLFEWVEVGFVLPVLLAQESGTSGEPFSNNPGAVGVGDLRLILKSRILKLGDLKDAPIGVGAVLGITTPTATASSFYGDDGVGVDARVTFDYNPWRTIRLGFNLGYRHRPETVVIQNSTMGSAVTIGGSAVFPFFNRDLDLITEIHGEITTASENRALSSEERPVEFDLGLRYRLWNQGGPFDDLGLTAAVGLGPSAVGNPDVRFIFGIGYFWVAGGSWQQEFDAGGYLAGIESCEELEERNIPEERWPKRCLGKKEADDDGDGIPNSKDDCPTKGTKGQVNARGCPTGDIDGDGIPDAQDKCPRTPEDKDNFDDSDGCPEPDNDGDGFPDLADKCPLEQEVINGIDDEDGCPDEDPNASVVVRDGKVEIKEQVFFKSGKAKIKKDSFKILNEVSSVLNKNPQIGGIEIEGHTDDTGDDEKNKKLSQKRAEAVMTYLTDRGVKANRLKAIGYGEEVPAIDISALSGERLKEARAKNRRVEFTIRSVPNPPPPNP